MNMRYSVKPYWRTLEGDILRTLAVGLLAIVALGLGTLISPALSRAATFVVDSTADARDAAPGDGTCATTKAVCTLRACTDPTDSSGNQWMAPTFDNSSWQPPSVQAWGQYRSA
jgi:CSLREA domain-containing protein